MCPADHGQRFRFLSTPDRTLAQAAFQFILSEPGVTMVLGGFSDSEHLEELAATSDAGALSAQDMSAIEGVWSSQPA